MRCYVRHFFGCQECAEHFEAMAAKSMDSVASREEAVLWLWSHHNEVNARLAGKGGCHGGKRGGQVEEHLPDGFGTWLWSVAVRYPVIVPRPRGQQLVMQHQAAPEIQLDLTCSLQGASQSCSLPSEDPSSRGGSSRCRRAQPLGSPGVYAGGGCSTCPL